MGREAAARWRRRGRRAFVDGLPTVLPRRTVLVLGVVAVVLVGAGVAGAWWAFDGGAVLRSIAGGALGGLSLAVLVAAFACTSRAPRAVRGLRRVRVLDEGLLFSSLGEDDVVTADAPAVEKLGRLVARQRVALPPLMLGQLLAGVASLCLLLAAGILGLSWYALAAAPFAVLNAISSTWTSSDALGRTETVAAALRNGSVVPPAPRVRRRSALGTADPVG